jgi:hypothetical protein
VKRRLRHTILIAAAALACCATPAASLASSADVIRDCSADGVLNGHYSQGELQGALHSLPSDLDEYTDCRSVIRQATLSKAGGKGGSNPGAAITKVNSSATATPSEQRRVDSAARAAGPVKIGDEVVTPGDAGFLAAAFKSHVPSLMLALLVVFALATLAGAALAFEHRWPRATHAAANGAARPFRALGRKVRRGGPRIRD